MISAPDAVQLLSMIDYTNTDQDKRFTSIPTIRALFGMENEPDKMALVGIFSSSNVTVAIVMEVCISPFWPRLLSYIYFTMRLHYLY